MFSLDIVDWKITTKCQCECDFCYASNQIASLSYDEINNIINEIVKNKCSTVCITGGEPLMHSHFYHIISALKSKGIRVYLSTNGYEYMNNICRIEPYINKLSLPLDGYDSESNACNGRPLSNFHVIIQILEYYKTHEHNFPIKVATVLTKNNSDFTHFEKMYTLMKNYNVNLWKIYEFIPEGRGIQNSKMLSMEQQEIDDFSKFISKFKDDTTKIKFIKKAERNEAYFMIQPDGTVFVPREKGGLFTELEIGNLLNEKFEKLHKDWCCVIDNSKYTSNNKTRNLL